MEYKSVPVGNVPSVSHGLERNASVYNNRRADDEEVYDSDGEIISRDDYVESVVSDSESVCSGANSSSCGRTVSGNGLLRLSDGDQVHDLIKNRFLMGLGSLARHATVVSIVRNTFRGIEGQAKVKSFQIFAKAVENKLGGKANVKYAWYGASKDEISKIIDHGFGPQMNDNNGLYGRGVYLAPDHSPLECLKSMGVEKDGLRHLFLCRVILGKQEVVPPGSGQCHPSSDEYDTGVDSLTSPKKYIVWSTQINTHIFPEYVVSFRAPPCLKGFFKTPRESLKLPSSPWMPFPALVAALSKVLPPTDFGLVAKNYKDHREKKISRQELIQRLRQIAGDQLLISTIKSFRLKQPITTGRFRQPTVQVGATRNEMNDHKNDNDDQGRMGESINNMDM